MTDFAKWFEAVTGNAPHGWQKSLAEHESCDDRVLRIPTGFGKTAGTLLPWLFHRVTRGDASWPTRLVFCLPMRVLVEQTERVIKEWLERAGHRDVPVFVLLGGREEARWVDYLDRPAVLIGTQDMLLSRALNRGYGSTRGMWPMEMGLLQRDTLWIVDEVQLMDVGLATTAQMRAFRLDDDERPGASLPRARTWWMSATLQQSWLETVDHARVLPEHPVLETSIPAALRRGGLWDVNKRLELAPSTSTPEEIAALARARHHEGAVTLVIVNTVDRAIKTFRALEQAARKDKTSTDLRLVHSRFRAGERTSWSFLRRDSQLEAGGRIIVATQVVEAGVDLSARLLVTDLAPWSSLVQRFGRCARYVGEAGEVVVVGAVPSDAKKAAPYEIEPLQVASDALTKLLTDADSAGPRALEEAEERWLSEEPSFVAQLFRYEPLHVLRRRDFDDLFDTTPDLSGADLDVSRFIRSGDERDVRVFWRTLEHTPRVLTDPIALPARAELCPVPVGALNEWLKKPGHCAYVLDYLDGAWKRVERLVPGMNVLLPASAGGYDTRTGWDPASATPVGPVQVDESVGNLLETTSASSDDDGLSAAAWKTIATHGVEAAGEARRIAHTLGLPSETARIVELAGRWHDAGKAHPHFQAAIRDEARHEEPRLIAKRVDLAKAPAGAWRKPHPYPERPGLRHELASTLALFELLRRTEPQHAALLGAHTDLHAAMGVEPDAVSVDERVTKNALADEVRALAPEEFDLLAWLVCTHHGKVRCSWTSTPRDQEKDHGGIYGVVEGDLLPAFPLCDSTGKRVDLPALKLSLALSEMGVGTRYGSSWAERVAGLLRRFGPTKLAALEAVLRVADWRASALASEDTE